MLISGIDKVTDVSYLIDLSQGLSAEDLQNIKLYLKARLSSDLKSTKTRGNIRVSIVGFANGKEKVIIPMNKNIGTLMMEQLINDMKLMEGAQDLNRIVSYMKNEVVRFRQDKIKPEQSYVIITSAPSGDRTLWEKALVKLKKNEDSLYTFVVFANDGIKPMKEDLAGIDAIVLNGTGELPNSFHGIADFFKNLGMFEDY